MGKYNIAKWRPYTPGEEKPGVQYDIKIGDTSTYYGCLFISGCWQSPSQGGTDPIYVTEIKETFQFLGIVVHSAEEFATEAHKDQLRDDGQPFIEHPRQVVQILSKITNDQNLLAAAWLHDTIEDTHITYEDILAKYGKDIADLVNEVTHEGQHDSKGFYFPRLKTQRGIMLKFADRLSNVSDMNSWDDKKQQHYLNKSKFWRSE